MENIDVTELADVNMLPDDAVISAMTPKILDDVELKPFSLLRQTIATDMCAFSASSNLFNIVITVWVCTLTPEECLKARDDVPVARIQAFEWAEKKGYTITNIDKLIDLYKKLNNELKAANVKMHQRFEDKEVPKNDGRQVDS